MIKRVLPFFVFLFFLFVFLFKSPLLLLAQNGNTLFLNPSNLERKIGETFVLEIKINASEKILGADIDLSYNPEILSFVKIAPADFFTNPQVLTNQNDPKKGLINFSIFSYPPQTGTATIATLTFQGLKETTQSTEIKFEPTTVLATVGEKKINFQTNPCKIKISQKNPTFVPTKSLSPTTSPSLAPFSTPTLTPIPTKPNIFVGLAKSLGILFILGGALIFILVLVVL